MEAAGRVLGPKKGTGGVPCSPVTLILSGGRAKRRTSCHSHHSSFSIHTHHFRGVEACFGFIMRIGALSSHQHKQDKVI